MAMKYLFPRRIVLPLVCLILLSGFNPSLHAQGIITGTMTGTVVDPSDAVVRGATVTAVDLAKGTSFATKSQGDGGFRFAALPIGSYRVTIVGTGFQTLSVPTIVVTAGRDSGLGREKLTLGVSTDVTVTPNTQAELDTTQSQVSASFNSEQLESLPLNNDSDVTALLMPGVAQTHDLGQFTQGNGTNNDGSNIGLSSNGARGRSNNFELDGQSNNDNTVTGPQIMFGNQDAIGEIQVIQTNFSAQYGRDSGTVVNYITKSGTNTPHGSAFEFYTGSFLTSYPNQDKSAAFGYCAPGETSTVSVPCTTVAALPRQADNKWGGTLGGPVVIPHYFNGKDKLFFFGSTYFEHRNNGPQPFNSGASYTPTPAGLTQLAGLFPGNPGVSILQNYGPYSVAVGNPQPVLSTAQTENVTAPSGSKVAIPVSAVQRIAPANNFTDQEDLGRLDWQATPKDRFYLRYMYQLDETYNDPVRGASGDFLNVPSVTHSVGADNTHTFSTAWLNQVRYSFQQSRFEFEASSFPNCTITSIAQCPGSLAFTGSDLGFGQVSAYPQGRTVKVSQIQDNVSFTKGRNTVLFGGEIDYQNSPSAYLPLYNGIGQFSSLNSFLHQTGNFYLAAGNPVIPFTETDYGLYFQDDLKATRELTLNLGLRWEFFGQAINELHAMTVARESNSATAIWSTALPLAARTVPTVNSAYKNFEPRVGFAYNPDFDRKLVVRGGYSIGFDPAFYNIFQNASIVAPVATSGNFACNGTCLGTGNFTGAGLRATNLSRLPIGGNPGFADQSYVPANFRNPYLETYSLGIEHQVLQRLVAQVRYVGTHGVGNFQSIDANPDLSSVKAAFPNAAPVALCTTAGAPGTAVNGNTGLPTARPNCNLGNQAYVANSGFSLYSALQTELTMRDFHGFSGNVSYTFSHATDNTSEVLSTAYDAGQGGNTVAFPQNPLNNDRAERGTSGLSYPNVFSVGMIYKVPNIHFSSAFVGKAVNGFQVNTVYQYNSGQPYTPWQPVQYINGLDNSYCDNAFNASSVGSGADSCRLVVSNPKAPLNTVGVNLGGTVYDGATFNPVVASSEHWLINNFDIANQLSNPYPGSGRNSLRAQPFDNLDASLFKDFAIWERVVVQLQMSAYNALNHQYRGTPNANAFADAVVGPGTPVNPFLSNAYSNSGSRTVQVGGKIKF
jgi:Carboxypeptidase regulatory-like domain/TonB dependent receptor/TonB-dependent Receptor Plug Domain